MASPLPCSGASIEIEAHLVRDADVLAQAIFEGELELDRLSFLLGRDLDREHHLVLIADRRAVGVGETMRRRDRALRPVSNSSILTVEARRHAGIAGIPPIGLPARLHAKLHTGDHAGLAVDASTVPRHEPHLRIVRPDPGATRPTSRQDCCPATQCTAMRQARGRARARHGRIGGTMQSWLPMRLTRRDEL